MRRKGLQTRHRLASYERASAAGTARGQHAPLTRQPPCAAGRYQEAPTGPSLPPTEGPGRCTELVQERSDEEAAERERSGGERVAAQQDHPRERDEDPLAPRRSLAASRESESTRRGHPPERPDDAECERRPHSRPVLDDIEDTCLLHGRRSRALRIASPVPIPATAS